MKYMKSTPFKDVVSRAEKIIQRFEQIEGRPWGAEGACLELSKQVGELARCILMQEKYYFSGRDRNPLYTTGIKQIGDELADVLYAIIRIARHYNISLEEAHIHACEDAEAALEKKYR
ncbi:hypothetical protein KBD13_02915 [Patescibacteria group bacterium]|nr:hypothetical protein [Patescibacteria group bacterium]